jgi:hypothetical protein
LASTSLKYSMNTAVRERRFSSEVKLALQQTPRQDGEPDFDLVQPRAMARRADEANPMGRVLQKCAPRLLRLEVFTPPFDQTRSPVSIGFSGAFSSRAPRPASGSSFGERTNAWSPTWPLMVSGQATCSEAEASARRQRDSPRGDRKRMGSDAATVIWTGRVLSRTYLAASAQDGW